MESSCPLISNWSFRKNNKTKHLLNKYLKNEKTGSKEKSSFQNYAIRQNHEDNDALPGNVIHRVSKLTKYELTRLKGLRIEQFSRGAFTLADIKKKSKKDTSLNITSLQNFSFFDLSPEELFQIEFEQGLCPYIVVRTNPDGTKTELRACEAFE